MKIVGLPGIDKPRFEFKYVLAAKTARAFLEALEREGALADPNHPVGYNVNSIYFDTSEKDAYYEKVDGIDPRYKIRARFYGELPDANNSPERIFLEAKCRENQTLRKIRVPILGSHLPVFLEPGPLGVSWPVEAHADPEAATILEGLVLRRPLHPWCAVTYFRKVYLHPRFPTLRITWDTSPEVRGLLNLANRTPGDGRNFLPPQLGVLEIKFHFAMPLWIQNLCQKYSLRSRRYSKFCSALEALYPALAERSPRFETLR